LTVRRKNGHIRRVAGTYDRIESDLHAARDRAERSEKLVAEARAILARKTADAETVAALRVLLR
jgi:hypothetical protein